MRTHLVAINCALFLVFAALFTIRVAQGRIEGAAIAGFVAFCVGFVACELYFGKDERL